METNDSHIRESNVKDDLVKNCREGKKTFYFISKKTLFDALKKTCAIIIFEFFPSVPDFHLTFF